MSIACQQIQHSVIIIKPVTSLMKSWLHTQGCFSNYEQLSDFHQPSYHSRENIVDFSQFRNRLRAQ